MTKSVKLKLMNKSAYVVFLLLLLSFPGITQAQQQAEQTNSLAPQTYAPQFDALNIKEAMTLSPMFTPDNALAIHIAWIKMATTTIDIQNQYITMFGSSWTETPLVVELLNAKTRGVNIRVQVREDSDSDNVTNYLLSHGIAVHWMGSSASAGGNSYLSATHNKMMIVDDQTALISSINYGENAFTNNREAGMVIQNTPAAQYFTSIFEADWAVGEVPPAVTPVSTSPQPSVAIGGYTSHTNLPHTNFTGTYNVTLFTNPDNADEVIFNYLKSAKTSIYVSMYTISRADFNNTLIDLKRNNPNLDIQVLISNRRVGASENIDTHAAAQSLVDNLIPVYNSTKDDDKVDGFYHNKYWIIDGKHTFVYSGNWSPRSVTPQLEPGDDSYSSGTPNRDMGIAVANAPDVAKFYTDVWKADVAVADAWDLPIGISQTTFTTGDVATGTVNLAGQLSGINATSVSYTFGDQTGTIAVSGSSFSQAFDTNLLINGVYTFSVSVTSSQTFTDSAKVTVANYEGNWKVLITELLPNPNAVSDTEGEFIELSNSFNFPVLLAGWQFGTDSALFTFADDYEIPAYTSIVIARDSNGLQTGYGATADFEFSFSLPNTAGTILFLDHTGKYIDVVAYGSDTAPDGSESVAAPGEDMSLQRSPTYKDTNTAADFIEASPDPKGSVDTPSDTSPVELPLNTFALLASFTLVAVLYRKYR